MDGFVTELVEVLVGQGQAQPESAGFGQHRRHRGRQVDKVLELVQIRP